MNAEKLLGFGLVAGLAAVCCAGPVLLAGLGSVALSALAGLALIPIVLAGIGLVGIWLYRRRRSTSSSAAGCCTIDDNIRKLKS